VAIVRFELKEEWISGITLAPASRGKGIADKILALGLQEFSKYHSDDIIAFIKKENIGSVKIFERNGFKLLEDGAIKKYKWEYNENWKS